MRLRTRSRGPWLIVLAGGDGSRLRPLVEKLYGYNLAKQFAVFRGTRSLLQKTLVRLRPHASPERTIVVSTRKWSAKVSEQLGAHPGVKGLLQPLNLGTGVAVLTALARIRRIEPDATVIISPSDHDVENPQVLENALFETTREVNRGDVAIAVMGIEPDWAETEYGWLVPGASIAPHSALRVVDRFVEKPEPDTAEKLYAAGAKWNSFIVAASATALWDLAQRELAAQTFLLELYARASREADAEQLLSRIFERMPVADFSRALLTKSSDLAVRTVAGCGWSDLGTPHRVLASLRGTSSYDAMLYLLSRPFQQSA